MTSLLLFFFSALLALLAVGNAQLVLNNATCKTYCPYIFSYGYTAVSREGISMTLDLGAFFAVSTIRFNHLSPEGRISVKVFYDYSAVGDGTAETLIYQYDTLGPIGSQFVVSMRQPLSWTRYLRLNLASSEINTYQHVGLLQVVTLQGVEFQTATTKPTTTYMLISIRTSYQRVRSVLLWIT